VIVPAFNEAAAIADTVQRLRVRLPAAEILVVDDGSSDATGATVPALDGVRLLVHAYNAGYGASIKTGAQAATRPYIAWFDADGEHDADDLAAMADRIEGERLVAVLGRRQLNSSPFVRLVGKLLIVLLARTFKVRQGVDLNCGLRVIRREVLVQILPILPDGFSASLTSTLALAERGYPVAFHNITLRSRVGQSKVRLRDGFRTMAIVIRLIMLFAPLRIFARSGVLLTLVGLVYGIAISVMDRRGFPVAAVVAVVVGFMLCMLGLIADQISQLRMEPLRHAVARIEPGDDPVAGTPRST
jgi:glycosyltransferase involved in cell wall biosynthesis